MASGKVEGIRADAALRSKLVPACLALLLAGYWVSANELVPLAFGARITPASRVGFAMRERNLSAPPEDWRLLKADVEALRSTLKPELRSTFDLVVALRGLESGGSSDFVRAGEICKGLQWRRCERAALDVLKERSRP